MIRHPLPGQSQCDYIPLGADYTTMRPNLGSHIIVQLLNILRPPFCTLLATLVQLQMFDGNEVGLKENPEYCVFIYGQEQRETRSAFKKRRG